MTLYLNISGTQAKQRAVQYEYIGRQGRRKLVPTYRAEMGRWDGVWMSPFHFAVTRDVAPVVFGKTDERFGSNGECPPGRNNHPYRGRHFIGQRNGLSIMLYDETSPSRTTLFDYIGNVIRSEIMVHGGPSSSLACMAVAGGRKAYRRWQYALERLLTRPDEDILVFIQPRPQADHDRHLSR